MMNSNHKKGEGETNRANSRKRIWRGWFWIIGVLFFIGLFALCCTLVIRLRFSNYLKSYAVVIDAGSTSSKIYLYSWLDAFSRTNARVQQLKKCVLKPGISNFKPNSVSSALYDKCLRPEILSGMPASRLDTTYMFLGATAGMRVLKKRNASESDAIFEALRKDLPDRYNLFRTAKNSPSALRENIRILSGDEEASNAWITANYLMRVWDKSVFSKLSSSSAATHSPVGTLDLGGASTQIAFAIPASSALSNSSRYISKLRLFSNSYTLYAKSYLCFGKSESQRRFLALLVQNENWKQTVDNPCLSRQLSRNWISSELFTVPCTRGEWAKKTFGYEITPPNNSPNMYTFVGKSNSTACREKVAKLFDSSKCSDTSKCDYPGTDQAAIPDSTQFKAFTGYYYTVKGLFDGAPIPTQCISYNLLINKTVEFCVKNLNEKEKKNQYSIWRCFDSYFMMHLLKSLKFSKLCNINFVGKINSATVGWPLGFLVRETGIIPIEKPLIYMSTNLFIFLLVIALLLLFVTLAIVLVILAKRRRRLRNRAADGNLETDNQLMQFKRPPDSAIES